MITGSLVAIVTPMLDDGSLDYPRLRSLIDWHVAEGSDGMITVACKQDAIAKAKAGDEVTVK